MLDYTPPPCSQSTNITEESGIKYWREGGREGGRKRGGRKGGRKGGREGRERGGRKGGREEGEKEGGKEGERREKRREERREESYHHLLPSSGVVQGTPALEHVHQKLVLCKFHCVHGCD